MLDLLFQKSFYLFKKNFNRIKRLMGFYSIQDWEPSSEKNNKNQQKYRTYFSLKFRVPKNSWFLLGVLHHKESKKVYGFIQINNSTFKQGRVMNATRLRWRIIRISQEGIIKLFFENIENHQLIKQIFLIKIPLFEVIKKINHKISREASILIKDKTNLVKKWKIYNKLFSIKKNNIIKYHDLIKLNESFQNNFFSKSQKYNLNFKNSNFQELNTVNEEDWIILKMHKNYKLSQIAIKSIKWALKKDPSIKIIYGDEDSINEKNERYAPLFRPAWNKELFITDPFYSSLYLIKGDIWNINLNQIKRNEKIINNKKILLYIINYIIEKNLEKKIKHLTVILGHNSNIDLKTTRKEKYTKQHFKYIRKYITEYSDKNCSMKISKSQDSLELYYPTPKDLMLSVIIPTKDRIDLLKNCINSIKSKKTGCKVEVIVVNNGSKNSSTLKYLDNLNSQSNENIIFRVIGYPNKFNYSAINNYAAKFCRGNTILLLNNDVKILSDNWAFYASSYALRKDIGCVGIKLLYPDDTIQHAGVIVGIYGSAAYSHKNYKRMQSGYAGRLQKTQEVSAVTGAFLAISKSNWEKLKGLNEKFLPINYNDVDLCLRAKELKLKNIYLPHIEAIHFESQSRGKPKGKEFIKWQLELTYFKLKWKKFLKDDPAYNPMLTLCKEDWSINLNKVIPKIR